MVNKVILIGNLGQDPETRTAGSTTVTNLRLATSEKYKDRDGNAQERTEWHTVVAWGPLGQNVQNYCKKGKMLYVEGSLSTRKWQDKNGADRYSTEVVAKEIRFLGGAPSESGGHERSASSGSASSGSAAQERPRQAAAPAPTDDDYEIPF